MARYVDGFVIPLSSKKIETYRDLAKKAAKVFIDHGALEVRECIAADMTVHCGAPFTRMVKSRRNETVVFSWIVYRSRAHRDRVNAKVMKDPRLADMDPEDMPFDMKRMVNGGFTTIVDAAATKAGE